MRADLLNFLKSQFFLENMHDTPSIKFSEWCKRLHFNFHVNVVGTDLAHHRLSHNDLVNINRSIKLDLTSPHSTINPSDNFYFKLTTSWSCLAFYGCFSVIVIASMFPY